MTDVLLRSAVSLITLFNLEGATASSVAESRFDHREVPEKHGGVAQLGEHLPCTQGVKGSNPFISTTTPKGARARGRDPTAARGLIAQAVRARA